MFGNVGFRGLGSVWMGGILVSEGNPQRKSLTSIEMDGKATGR